MDRINELLDRLADLTDSEISDLEAAILSAFADLEEAEPTTDTVDQMTSLADHLDSVRSELTRRSKLEAELKAKAQEASSRIKNTSASNDDEDDDAEDMPEVVVDEQLPIDPDSPPEAVDIEVIEEPDGDIDVDVTETDTPLIDDLEEPSDSPMDDEMEMEKKKKKKAMPFSDNSEDSASTTAESSEPAELSAPAADEAADPATTAATVSGEAEASSASGENSDTNVTQQSEAELATASETEAPTIKEEGMTASSGSQEGAIVPPASAAPVARATVTDGLNIAITAGADIPGFGAGQQLSDMREVSEAFSRRLHTLSNVMGSDGQRYNIASLKLDYPDDRHLGRDDASNFAALDRVTSSQAITAAAGSCVPLETRYDMEICGDDDRPIRDAMARFSADRGGVRIYRAPSLCADGVGVWDPKPNTYPPAGSTGGGTGGAPFVTPGSTIIAGTGASGGTAKTCCDATCPAPDEVYLKAVYNCMCFSNYTNRFFPEVIKANTDLSMIQHARVAEMFLLKRLYDLSTEKMDWRAPAKDAPAGLGGGAIGFARQLVVQLISASNYLRRKHRLRNDRRLRAILPQWVAGAVEADLIQQMPGDGLEVFSMGTSRVDAFLNAHNINVTWSLDSWNPDGVNNDGGTLTATHGGLEAELGFPLFVEGEMLFLDGGTLDLGVTRDSGNIKSNDYCTFVETFEEVAFTGCSAAWLKTKVCASGAAAALVDNACK